MQLYQEEKRLGQEEWNKDCTEEIPLLQQRIYFRIYSFNNLSNITSSKSGERLEQGTNTTIEIFENHLSQDRIDPNAENNQACQAPIKPYGPQSYSNVGIGFAAIGTTFAIDEWTAQVHPSNKPDNYIAHESSVLLGMATKGRPSRRYYRYKQYNSL